MAENKDEEEEEETANWSDLPYDLMELILKQLTKVVDISNYARWAAVCVSWRHALDIYDLNIDPQLPLLMIPAGTDYNAPSPSSSSFNDDGELAADGFCSFYRTTDKKVLDQFQVSSMPRNSHCRGSGHGWLIMVDDDLDKGFPVRLFNPFLSEEILLPSLKHLPQGSNENNEENNENNEDPCDGYTYLHKAILSAEPLSHPNNYIVMVIYGNKFKRLAFCTSGDKAWTPIECNTTRFEDVNYQARRCPDDSGDWEIIIWAVTCEGYLLSIYLEQEMGILLEQVDGLVPSVVLHTCKKLYLVSTKNKTWILVLRTIDIHDDKDETITNDDDVVRSSSIPYSTKEFKVFKLITTTDHREDDDDDEYCKEWKEIHNLRGHTLFVGDNNSMLIDAADYPGCKPNCIYYTDDYYLEYHVKKKKNNNSGGHPHDMGVFNVKDGTFEKHFLSDHTNPMCSVPVWIEPSLSLQKKRNIHRHFI